MVESGALVAEPQGWRVEPLGHGRPALLELGGRLPLPPHRTPAAAGRRPADDGGRAGQGIRPAAGGGTRRARVFAGHRRVGEGPRAALRLGAHGRRPLRFRPRQDPRRLAGAAFRRSERQELHHRIALSLQANAPDRIFDLAYHFDAAGHSEQALPYALQAAGQARSQYSLEVAEQQYRIADRGAASADRATQYAIAEGLGDVLMLRGQYDEAAELFAAARRVLGDGEFARAKIQGKIGELAFKRGDMESATLAFEDTLRLLGRTVPRRKPMFLLLARVGGRRPDAAHSVSRASLSIATSGSRRQPNLLAFPHVQPAGPWILVRAGIDFSFYGLHLRGMNLAERYATNR